MQDMSTAACNVATTAPAALSDAFLAVLHQRYKDNSEGKVATSLPELARADPCWFGLSAVTVDGAVHACGDSARAFTIQSIAKPFVFGLALEDYV
jgi:glutaminase